MVRQRSNLALVTPASAAGLHHIEPSERRAHERLTVSALDWLNEARLKYGPGVSLIDLSVGGAQIETQGHRLHPGSTLVIELAARHGEFTIPARVIRCHVSQIVPHPIFRGALEFKRPFSLPDSRVEVAPAGQDVNPFHEHARLTTALRRLTGVEPDTSPATELTGVTEASLSAALAMLESPAGRRAGAPFALELGRLFRALSRALDADGPVDLVADIAERLRRVVPARSIRLLDAAAPPAPQSADAIRFDVPSSGGTQRTLIVEFPRGCRLEEWHLQLLKAAAHLATFAEAVNDARKRSATEAQRADTDNVLGWHRLVVRYNDGRMLKGFGRDFYPAKGQVHVWQAPDGPPQSRISVQLTHLKAVFFVHDFAGATGVEQPPAGLLSGRAINVTFMDGEVLAGRTLNYSAQGPGFFMTPTDAGTNNHRIFVVNNAVRTVQFP